MSCTYDPNRAEDRMEAMPYKIKHRTDPHCIACGKEVDGPFYCEEHK
jgi:hypothetical protein